MIYQQRPDLVILDMMMPRMGGYPVLEHFRDKTDAPPIIMITANEGSRHKAYAEYLGVIDYIRKPFAMERLLEAVEQRFEPAEVPDRRRPGERRPRRNRESRSPLPPACCCRAAPGRAKSSRSCAADISSSSAASGPFPAASSATSRSRITELRLARPTDIAACRELFEETGVLIARRRRRHLSTIDPRS